MSSNNQAGKGMTPKRGYNHKKYRENHDNIFKRFTCDICGQFISTQQLENGEAVKRVISIDSDYSEEEYETFHVKCYKK